jgi:hypothetical protein
MSAMNRSYWIGVAALVLLAAPLSLAAGPADNAESPLAQVPAKAPIVIQVRGYEQTKDRLVAMIKEALPDLAGKIEGKINEQITKGLEGRSLKGLAENGPMFIIFSDFPTSNDEDELKKKAAVLVRVTKYAEFRDALLTADERKALKKENGYETTQVEGEEAFFVDRGEYVVLASSKEAAQTFAKKPAQGLDKKLRKDLADKLLESDLAAYVDMVAVRAQFGDQIAQAKEQAEQTLANAEDAAGLQKSQLELAKRMIGPIFQAIEDSQAIILAVDFRKPGLAIHAQASVGGSSKTGQFLKDIKPSALEAVGRLPAGMISYSAFEVRPEMLKDLGGYLYGPNDASGENKNLKAALDELAAAKPRMRVDATGIPLKGIQVWTYDDPAKAVAAQLKMVRALKAGDVFQAAPIMEPTIKEKAEKHGSFELHSFRAKWDFDKWLEQLDAGGNLPEQAKQIMPALMKKLLGEEINVWFGTDGKSVVQLTAPNWKAAQALLDQYVQGKKPLSNDQAYKDARVQLPKETSFLVLTDIPSFAQNLVGALPLPIPPAGKPKASYLGLAITVQPEQGSIDLWLPGATVQEIYKIAEPFIKLIGGRLGGAS